MAWLKTLSQARKDIADSFDKLLKDKEEILAKERVTASLMAPVPSMWGGKYTIDSLPQYQQDEIVKMAQEMGRATRKAVDDEEVKSVMGLGDVVLILRHFIEKAEQESGAKIRAMSLSSYLFECLWKELEIGAYPKYAIDGSVESAKPYIDKFEYEGVIVKRETERFRGSHAEVGELTLQNGQYSRFQVAREELQCRIARNKKPEKSLDDLMDEVKQIATT